MLTLNFMHALLHACLLLALTNAHVLGQSPENLKLLVEDCAHDSSPSNTDFTAFSRSVAPKCSAAATTFHLNDSPYRDYFYSDCHSASQVVVTSPLPGSNLSLIGPRLLVSLFLES